MLNLLAQDNIPDGISDVVILPFGLTLIGLVIYFAGWRLGKRMPMIAPWKWFGVAPLACALWIGWFGHLSRWLGSPVYQVLVATGREKKMMAAHWAAFVIPLLGLVAVILLHFYSDRIDLGLDDD
ncbi:MAG TPA: hypothetical protein VMI31_09910 [Fimbriimonadaceae bacterium]|nr:hypothetical protein [Fimbriimonadaceae bacterium]